MKCKCRAKPRPDVLWFRGTTIVKETTKISIRMIDVEEDIYELTMNIKVCIYINKCIIWFIINFYVLNLL